MEMSLFQVSRRVALVKRGLSFCFLTISVAALSGCSSVGPLSSSQLYKEGYILDREALDSVPVGSSQEQVLLALGSPSLKAKYGNEVFYYISQTRYRAMQFMKTRIIDRRVLAIYFDKDRKIAKIADYGLRDGQMFDFITQTTPTPGSDQGFLAQLMKGLVSTPNLPIISH